MKNKRKEVNDIFLNKIGNVILFISIISLFYAGFQIITSENNLKTYFLGYKPIIINNDAMGEALPKNSIAIAQNISLSDDIKENDIIMYVNSEKLTTHRVIKINGENIVTKADTAYDNDPYVITKDDVDAKIITHTPSLKILNYKIFDFLKK